MKTKLTFMNFLRAGILLLFSTAFLLIFAYHQSPICNGTGYDTSFFKLVGQGMTQGMLPYRDFFDMKGPWLFLIQYFGQLISYGDAGIFLIEVVNLFIAMMIISKIFRRALGESSLWKELLLLLPFAYYAAIVLGGGNQNEEYCLVPLLLCLYLYIRRLESESVRHPPRYALIYGACFSYIAFLRVNNAAGICAIVFCELIHLFSVREYKNLLNNMLFFMIGAAAATLPIFIYCVYHGIWNEMLNAVFAYGFKYAAEKNFLNFSLQRIIFFLPLFILPPAFRLHENRSTSRRFAFFTLVHLLTTIFVVCMGNDYKHYFLLAIPQLTLGFYLFVRYIQNGRRKLSRLLCMLLVAVLFFCPLKSQFTHYAKIAKKTMTSDVWTDQHAPLIYAKIPETDRDSIFAYGMVSCSRFYIQTGTFPPFKYCDWHQHQIEFVPEIANEIARFMDETPPRWIVTQADMPLADFMTQRLEKNYLACYSTGKYLLWQYIA